MDELLKKVKRKIRVMLHNVNFSIDTNTIF